MAVFNAQTDNQVACCAKLFHNLGKTVFAVFDKQDDRSFHDEIVAFGGHPFENTEEGFEELIVVGAAEIRTPTLCGRSNRSVLSYCRQLLSRGI